MLPAEAAAWRVELGHSGNSQECICLIVIPGYTGNFLLGFSCNSFLFYFSSITLILDGDGIIVPPVEFPLPFHPLVAVTEDSEAEKVSQMAF